MYNKQLTCFLKRRWHQQRSAGVGLPEDVKYGRTDTSATVKAGGRSEESGNPLAEFVSMDGKRYVCRLRTTSDMRARLFFYPFNAASVSVKIIA
jgi:hypothetical protein